MTTADANTPSSPKLVGTALRGIDSPARTLALLFARAVHDDAQKLYAAQARQVELEATQAELSALEQKMEELRAASKEFEKSKAAAESKRTKTGLAIVVIVFCLVVGIMVPPFFLGVVIGFVLLVRALKIDAMSLDEASSALKSNQHELTDTTNNGQQVHAEVQSLHASLTDIPKASCLEALGLAHFPVEVFSLAGHTVAADPLGATRTTTLTLPKLEFDGRVLDNVRRLASDTEPLPLLLLPSKTDSSFERGLHGIEETFKGTVEAFADGINKIKVVECSESLYHRKSGVVQLLNKNKPRAVASVFGPVLTTATNPSAREKRRKIQDVARTLRTAGADAGSVIMEAHSQLSQKLHHLRQLREGALDILHDEFVDAMARSSLLSVHCFDPKASGVPNYIFSILGVDLDEAHTIEPNELADRLMSNDDIARRIQNQPELVDALDESRVALDTVAAQTRAIDQADAALEDISFAEKKATHSRNKAIASQYAAALAGFRRCLLALVTGSPNPQVVLGQASHLHYDPVQDVWVSDLDDATYTEEEAAMARVLKVKADLMLPMWNQLWVEQEAFRKSELFRTNEALQRMGEKESEKLLAIAESYKADLRPVRENLIRYASEAEAKHVQLTDTIQGLQDMGYMSEAKAQAVRKRIQGTVGNTIADTKRRAETQELVLSTEPKAQLQRRPPAADPIDMLVTPASLFALSPKADAAQLLSPSDAGNQDHNALLESAAKAHANDSAPTPAPADTGE